MKGGSARNQFSPFPMIGKGFRDRLKSLLGHKRGWGVVRERARGGWGVVKKKGKKGCERKGQGKLWEKSAREIVREKCKGNCERKVAKKQNLESLSKGRPKCRDCKMSTIQSSVSNIPNYIWIVTKYLVTLPRYSALNLLNLRDSVPRVEVVTCCPISF